MNRFRRKGGMSAIVAIRVNARITLENNQVHGGVCAWLIEGRGKSLRNQFLGFKKNRVEESGLGGIVGACRAKSAGECSMVSFRDQGRVGPSSKSVLQSCRCCNFVGRLLWWVSRCGGIKQFPTMKTRACVTPRSNDGRAGKITW